MTISDTPIPGSTPLTKALAYRDAILPLLSTPTFLRATFAGTQRFQKSPTQKAALRTVQLAEGPRLQLSRFDGRKVLYSNHTPEELPAALADLLAIGFSNVHITLQTEEIDLRLTKKGDLLIGRTPTKAPKNLPTTHNLPKELPLSEGRPDPLLLAMGILDRNNNVRPAMRDKFTQINEFLKLLDHVLPEVMNHRQDADATLNVLDCGCGSSLLTLATVHFLNTIKKIPARVTGIDANEELITKSQARAADLTNQLRAEASNCDLQLNINFLQAKIGQVENLHADIVLALHACDTATDDAIAQAIKSNAKLLLAVPCCHKNLNGTLHIPALAPLHHHGILHQRQADLITDTFRALLLKVMGYRAEVIEFISAEHTARNLMIRAVKVRPPHDPAALREYIAFKQFTGATPYLEKALNLSIL